VCGARFPNDGRHDSWRSHVAEKVHSRLVDVGVDKIAQVDADGIDLAVLSITSPGVQVFNRITATRLAADANDVLSAAVNTYPKRLAGLASAKS